MLVISKENTDSQAAIAVSTACNCKEKRLRLLPTTAHPFFAENLGNYVTCLHTREIKNNNGNTNITGNNDNNNKNNSIINKKILTEMLSCGLENYGLQKKSSTWFSSRTSTTRVSAN